MGKIPLPIYSIRLVDPNISSYLVGTLNEFKARFRGDIQRQQRVELGFAFTRTGV